MENTSRDPHGSQAQSYRFIEKGENKTRWIATHEFKFSGMMLLMSIFMRGAFPEKTLEDMQHFKEFAENL